MFLSVHNTAHKHLCEYKITTLIILSYVACSDSGLDCGWMQNAYRVPEIPITLTTGSDWMGARMGAHTITIISCPSFHQSALPQLNMVFL